MVHARRAAERHGHRQAAFLGRAFAESTEVLQHCLLALWSEREEVLLPGPEGSLARGESSALRGRVCAASKELGQAAWTLSEVRPAYRRRAAFCVARQSPIVLPS